MNRVLQESGERVVSLAMLLMLVPYSTYASTVGIYIGDGLSISTVATTDNPLFAGFDLIGPDLSDNGSATFIAFLSDGTDSVCTCNGAIYSNFNGSLTQHANTAGAYSLFTVSSINNAGKIAFSASETSSYLPGIYTGPDPIADKVVRPGDIIFGKTLLLAGLSKDGLNNHGEIAFTALYEDGSYEIIKATPSSSGYSYTSITSSTTSTLSSPAINDDGKVVFREHITNGPTYLKIGDETNLASLDSGSIFGALSLSNNNMAAYQKSTNGDWDLYKAGADIPVTLIKASTGPNVRGGSINDSGEVAYVDGYNNLPPGVYLNSGGALVTIADESDGFTRFGYRPSVSNDGSVGFYASDIIPGSNVPVLPAVWLFGSGLLGLIGVARRH